MKRANKRVEFGSEVKGRVSAAVADLLRKQVEDRGIVVWHDPRKAYGELVKRLEIADCTILRHEDGFFRLREQLEPFLECANCGATTRSSSLTR